MTPRPIAGIDSITNHYYREPEYHEESRVKELTGEERWIAQIKGKGANDLAARTYTMVEIHATVTHWIRNLSRKTAENIIPGYDSIYRFGGLPFDMKTLQDIYIILWDYCEDHPEFAEWDILPDWLEIDSKYGKRY